MNLSAGDQFFESKYLIRFRIEKSCLLWARRFSRKINVPDENTYQDEIRRFLELFFFVLLKDFFFFFFLNRNLNKFIFFCGLVFVSVRKVPKWIRLIAGFFFRKIHFVGRKELDLALSKPLKRGFIFVPSDGCTGDRNKFLTDLTSSRQPVIGVYESSGEVKQLAELEAMGIPHHRINQSCRVPLATIFHLSARYLCKNCSVIGFIGFFGYIFFEVTFRQWLKFFAEIGYGGIFWDPGEGSLISYARNVAANKYGLTTCSKVRSYPSNNPWLKFYNYDYLCCYNDDAVKKFTNINRKLNLRRVTLGENMGSKVVHDFFEEKRLRYNHILVLIDNAFSSNKGFEQVIPERSYSVFLEDLCGRIDSLEDCCLLLKSKRKGCYPSTFSLSNFRNVFEIPFEYGSSIGPYAKNVDLMIGIGVFYPSLMMEGLAVGLRGVYVDLTGSAVADAVNENFYKPNLFFRSSRDFFEALGCELSTKFGGELGDWSKYPSLQGDVLQNMDCDSYAEFLARQINIS